LKKSTKFLYYITGLIILIIIFFPLIWGIKISLSPKLYDVLDLKFSLEHYLTVFSREGIYNSMKNSLLVSSTSIGIIIPLSLLSGYSLARFSFPGKRLEIVYLLFPLLPPVAILVSLLLFFNLIGLYNTLGGLILAHVVFNLPFTIWMAKGAISAIPVEIEEQSLIDGCSRVKSFFRITLPLSLQGIITIASFTFIVTWINYLYAFALTPRPELHVLPITLLAFIGSWGTYYQGLMAVGIMILLPVITIFFIFNKLIIAGLSSGAVKG